MTRGTDFEQILDRYLADGPESAPEGAIDEALLEVDRTHQRFALQIPGRIQMLSSQIGIAAVGLAAIALVVGGLVWVNGLGIRGAGSPPTAMPSGTQVAQSPAARPTRSQSTAAEGPAGHAIVNLDGTVIQELRLPRDAWAADLSADGSEIAFLTRSIDVAFCGRCGYGAPRQRVAIVGIGAGSPNPTYALPWGDGEGLNADSISTPVWSPDGTMLAFQAAAAADPGNLDIWVITLDRSNPVMTTGDMVRLTDDPAPDSFPAWSPDGRTILYDNAGSARLDESGFSPTQEIWAVAADGGDPVRLTSNDEADSQPDVRADGTIAFWRAGRIWTMGADGTSQQMLDKVPGGFSPRWSPDGNRIALLRGVPGERAALDVSLQRGVDLPLLEVIVVDVDSGEVTEVGQRVPTDVNAPSWLPDGSGLLTYRYD